MSTTKNSGSAPTSTAPSTAPKSSGNDNDLTSKPTGGVGAEYPEQIHAGAVGYGPNFHAGPTLADKVEGLKDEIKGKLTHNPDLVQHGREVKSGEDRRKKLTGEDEPNPFAHAGNDKDESSSSTSKESSSNATTQRSGSDATNTDRHRRSRPMQPADNTSPTQLQHPSESSDYHQPNNTKTHNETANLDLAGLDSSTDSVPQAPVSATVPSSLPFQANPSGSINEQEERQTKTNDNPVVGVKFNPAGPTIAAVPQPRQ